MNKVYLRITVLFCIICVVGTSCGQENRGLGNKQFVYDYENVLTLEQQDELALIIKKFEKETTKEIAIVTVDNIGKFDLMVEYAVDFGAKHQIGKRENGNGLIILFSKSLRKTFLATGCETEKILKDEICKEIVDYKMLPYFKKQDYYGGIKSGLQECINEWK